MNYKTFSYDKKFRETFINRYYEEIQLYPYQKTELLRLLDELNISGDDVRKSLSASFERAQDTGIMSVKEAADFIILELSGDVDQSRELAYKLAKKSSQKNLKQREIYSIVKSPFAIINEIIDSDDGFVRFHFSAHTKGALLYIASCYVVRTTIKAKLHFAAWL